MSKQIKRSIGARLNEKGLEVLSSIKKAVHVKVRRPVSEHQRFRQYLDAQSKAAAMAGEDTYEEFMDFGPDDPSEFPESQYELVVDPRTGKEMLPAEKIWLDQRRAEWERSEKEQRKRERASAQAPQGDPDPQQAPKKTKSKSAPKTQSEDDAQ